jgi:menaquinone-9 beta-reductase
MGINLAETPIGNTVTHTKVYLNSQPLSEGDFPEVEGMPRFAKVVPIKAFNQALLSSTRSTEATVREGWHAINFAVEANWVTIIIGTKETTRTLRARMLIGADGVNSIVARRLKGAGLSSTQRVVAARAQYNYASDNPSQAFPIL